MNVFFVFDEFSDVEDEATVRTLADIIMDALRNPNKARPSGESIVGEITRQYVLTQSPPTPDADFALGIGNEPSEWRVPKLAVDSSRHSTHTATLWFNKLQSARSIDATQSKVTWRCDEKTSVPSPHSLYWSWTWIYPTR